MACEGLVADDGAAGGKRAEDGRESTVGDSPHGRGDFFLVDGMNVDVAG